MSNDNDDLEGADIWGGEDDAAGAGGGGDGNKDKDDTSEATAASSDA